MKREEVIEELKQLAIKIEKDDEVADLSAMLFTIVASEYGGHIAMLHRVMHSFVEMIRPNLKAQVDDKLKHDTSGSGMVH